ncbi:MAG TPA: hypothetical protein VGM54_15210 [Chthoniobacter sp.]
MKDTAPSSDPLPNSRHEAFAREIAAGRNATQAYLNVYGTKNHRPSDPARPSNPYARAARTRRVASTGGHRLLLRKSIVARVRALQQAGAAVVALNLQEIHAFLTRVVRTPAGEIIPSSDLCTRVKHLRDGATDVWMPNKLACLRLSAKLQGFLDTASPARTANPARTPAANPAKSDPSNSSEPDTPPVLTEERRQVLIAQRRAILQARQSQPDEQHQENPPIEPEHRATEKRPTEEPSPDGLKPRTESTPVRPEPSVPPRPNHPRPAPYFGQAFRRPPNPQPQPNPSAGSPVISVPHQHPPSPSRVNPDSASQIVII